MVICSRCDKPLPNIPEALEDKATWCCRPCAKVAEKPDHATCLDLPDGNRTIHEVWKGRPRMPAPRGRRRKDSQR